MTDSQIWKLVSSRRGRLIPKLFPIKKRNKSIHPTRLSLFMRLSLSLRSAIIPLAQCCLIDIRCTSRLANALSSLQPQWEEACQYEAGVLLWFWKATFLIPLSAIPAASFTYVWVVGISKAWLGSLTAEFCFFFFFFFKFIQRVLMFKNDQTEI